MTIKFEPRDMWIGWFWDRRRDGTHHYVCIVPTIVIHWVTGKLVPLPLDQPAVIPRESRRQRRAWPR